MAILAKGTNTPLPINTSILLPIGVISLNVPLIDPKKRPKYTMPYLKRQLTINLSPFYIY